MDGDRHGVDLVLDWYDGNARELPWRGPSASPWSVMVSEFMLQQTPVARVLPVHEQWLERWPTPTGLAADSSGEAVRLWGRLGYPRRALRLHAAATAIVENHGGQVPSSYADLLALPGIGDYTAAAIASFAFGRRHVVLDTNVRRVLARWRTGVEFPAASVTRAERDLAESVLPDRGYDRGDLVGRHHGVGRVGVHRRPATCGACPLDRRLRLASGRISRTRRPAANRTNLGRHRPTVPRPAARRGSRR